MTASSLATPFGITSSSISKLRAGITQTPSHVSTPLAQLIGFLIGLHLVMALLLIPASLIFGTLK